MEPEGFFTELTSAFTFCKMYSGDI
jgi:hypothetical protein